MNPSYDFSATLPGFTFARTAPPPLHAPSVGLLEHWSNQLKAWRLTRRQRPDLAVLNDHLLRDIGMNRSQAHLLSGKFNL